MTFVGEVRRAVATGTWSIQIDYSVSLIIITERVFRFLLDRILDQMSRAVDLGCHAPWQSFGQGRRIGARLTQLSSLKNRLCTRASNKSVEIEAIGGISSEIDAAISLALDNCLTETDLGIGTKYEVRQVVITTTSYSACSLMNDTY